MNNLLRELVVTIASKVWPSNVFLERLLAISIMTRDYSEVFSVKKYNSREEMWSDGLRQLASDKLTYLEFGVWKGATANFFSEYVNKLHQLNIKHLIDYKISIFVDDILSRRLIPYSRNNSFA